MKKYLPIIADTLLAAFCAFLVFFTLVRYYANSAAGIAAGIAAATASGTAAFLYKKHKYCKKYDLSFSREEAEKLAVHLAVLPRESAVELFSACFEDCKKGEDCILTDGAVYYINFSLEPANLNDLIPVLQSTENGKKYLACCSATPACAEFAKKRDIEIMTADDIYAKLKKRGKLPEKYLCEGAAGAKFFAKVRARFTRKLCLPAFWSGAALLFFSYFTFYPAYYIAAGTALLLLCAAAAVFGGSRRTET